MPTTPTVSFVTITIGALVVQVLWPTSPAVEFEQRKVLRHEDMLRITKLLYNVVGRLGGGGRLRNSNPVVGQPWGRTRPIHAVDCGP